MTQPLLYKKCVSQLNKATPKIFKSKLKKVKIRKSWKSLKAKKRLVFSQTNQSQCVSQSEKDTIFTT